MSLRIPDPSLHARNGVTLAEDGELRLGPVELLLELAVQALGLVLVQHRRPQGKLVGGKALLNAAAQCVKMQLYICWKLAVPALTHHLSLLERYPPNPQDDLQAWDSADEYLLQSLVASQLDPQRPILVLGDQFGALSCALAGSHVSVVNDSYVSHKAIEHNLNRQGLAQVQLLSPLDDWPQQPQLVLGRLPKQLSMLEFYLAKLKPLLAPDSLVFFAGRDRDIPERAEALLSRYLGPTDRLLGWKKARAFVSRSDGKAPLPQPAPLSWPLEGTDYQLVNHANVFSRQSLDIGARLLLANLPQGRFDRVIDLGCGNGVLALMMASQYPEARYQLVDESYLAVASAKANMAGNLPTVAADFIANNCLDGFERASADLVLCNPPFHQQQVVTDHIAWQMFKDAFKVLRQGGQLWIVGNRHLGYQVKLSKLFGGCQVVASDRKFIVLKAIKRRTS